MTDAPPRFVKEIRKGKNRMAAQRLDNCSFDLSTYVLKIYGGMRLLSQTEIR